MRSTVSKRNLFGASFIRLIPDVWVRPPAVNVKGGGGFAHHHITHEIDFLSSKPFVCKDVWRHSMTTAISSQIRKNKIFFHFQTGGAHDVWQAHVAHWLQRGARMSRVGVAVFAEANFPLRPSTRRRRPERPRRPRTEFDLEKRQASLLNA